MIASCYDSTLCVTMVGVSLLRSALPLKVHIYFRCLLTLVHMRLWVMSPLPQAMAWRVSGDKPLLGQILSINIVYCNMGNRSQWHFPHYTIYLIYDKLNNVCENAAMWSMILYVKMGRRLTTYSSANRGYIFLCREYCAHDSSNSPGVITCSPQNRSPGRRLMAPLVISQTIETSKCLTQEPKLYTYLRWSCTIISSPISWNMRFGRFRYNSGYVDFNISHF